MLCFSAAGNHANRTSAGDTFVAKEALTPFHIAVQVRDIAEARHFYGKFSAAVKAAAANNGSTSISTDTSSSAI